MASSIFKAGIRVFGKRTGSLVSASLAERLIPVIVVQTNYGLIKFYCPGKVCLWRAETLLIKEPGTIEWIDNFDQDCVFWDIGANVGVYSLYAALKSNIKVLSFEPAASNYYILNRNIEINKMDDKIVSLCMAFNDNACFDYFYMKNTEAGSALHGFAQALDEHEKPFISNFKQGMIGLSIDDFVEKFNPPFPNHIKIDVDGIEGKIINGARRTFADKRVRSILVELDAERQDSYQKAIAALEEAGMELSVRIPAPACETGEFASVSEHIFIRC